MDVSRPGRRTIGASHDEASIGRYCDAVTHQPLTVRCYAELIARGGERRVRRAVRIESGDEGVARGAGCRGRLPADGDDAPVGLNADAVRIFARYRRGAVDIESHITGTRAEAAVEHPVGIEPGDQ